MSTRVQKREVSEEKATSARWLVRLLLLALVNSCSEQSMRRTGDSRRDLPHTGADLGKAGEAGGDLPHTGADLRAASDVGGDRAHPDLNFPVIDGRRSDTLVSLDAHPDHVSADLPGDSGLGPDSAPLCPLQGLLPGDHTLSLSHGGLSRTVLVHVPPAATSQFPLPLVLNFHGLGGIPSQQAQKSQMSIKADQEGFIVAYPAGYQSSWNAGVCCGEAASTNVDDVGFVRAILAELATQACIDQRRIYATGMSNGGLMSYRLACEAADLFVAIAPVAGLLALPSCTPARPVPIIHFHGTDDSLAAYSSAVSTITGWVSRNGCTDIQPTETYRQGMVTCEAYQQCTDGVEVQLCTVSGGGHCWPGNITCPLGVSTTDINATDAMWSFFERFSLP